MCYPMSQKYILPSGKAPFYMGVRYCNTTVTMIQYVNWLSNQICAKKETVAKLHHSQLSTQQPSSSATVANQIMTKVFVFQHEKSSVGVC